MKICYSGVQNMFTTRFGSSSFAEYFDESQHWKKIKVFEKEIDVYDGDVPGYGACLLYSVAVGALLPTLENDDAFSHMLSQLFGPYNNHDSKCMDDETLDKGAIKALLRKYQSNPNANILEKNEQFRGLIDNRLRFKVVTFIDNHQDEQPESISLKWRTYKEYLLIDYNKSDSFKGILESLKRETEWCDNTVFAALSEMLESPILQYKRKRSQLCIESEYGNKYKNPVISVLYTNARELVSKKDHYHCLIPRQFMKIQSKTAPQKKNKHQKKIDHVFVSKIKRKTSDKKNKHQMKNTKNTEENQTDNNKASLSNLLSLKEESCYGDGDQHILVGFYEEEMLPENQKSQRRSIKLDAKNKEEALYELPYRISLLYAVALAVLVPALLAERNSWHTFKESFNLLFNSKEEMTDNASYVVKNKLGHEVETNYKDVRKLLFEYLQNLHGTDVLQQIKAGLKGLINKQLRLKVEAFISSHKSKRAKSIEKSDITYEDLLNKYHNELETVSSTSELCEVPVLAALSEMLRMPIYQIGKTNTDGGVEKIAFGVDYKNPPIVIRHIDHNNYRWLIKPETIRHYLRCEKQETSSDDFKQHKPVKPGDPRTNAKASKKKTEQYMRTQEMLMRFHRFSQKEIKGLEQHQKKLDKSIANEEAALKRIPKEPDLIKQLQEQRSKCKETEKTLKKKVAELDKTINTYSEVIGKELMNIDHASPEMLNGLDLAALKRLVEMFDQNIDAESQRAKENSELEKKAAKQLSLEDKLKQAKQVRGEVAKLSGGLKKEVDSLIEEIKQCNNKLGQLSKGRKKREGIIKKTNDNIEKLEKRKLKEKRQLKTLEKEIEDYKRQQDKKYKPLSDKLSKSRSMKITLSASVDDSRVENKCIIKIDNRVLKSQTKINDGVLVAFIDRSTCKEIFSGYFKLDADHPDEYVALTKKIKQLKGSDCTFIICMPNRKKASANFTPFLGDKCAKNIANVLGDGVVDQILGDKTGKYMTHLKNKGVKLSDNGVILMGFLYYISGPGFLRGGYVYNRHNKFSKTVSFSYDLTKSKWQEIITERISKLDDTIAKKTKQYKDKESTLKTKIKSSEDLIASKQSLIKKTQIALKQDEKESIRLKNMKKSCETKKSQKEPFFDLSKSNLRKCQKKEKELRSSLGEEVEEKPASEPEEKQEDILKKALTQLNALKKQRREAEEKLASINNEIKTTDRELRQVPQQVKASKEAKERIIKNLKAKKAAYDSTKVVLDKDLKEHLDRHLLMNGKVLAGYTSNKTLPESNQFIIAILQFIHEDYASYDLKVDNFNKPYPESWDATIKAVLKIVEISNKKLTEALAKKIVACINDIYAGDKIQIGVKWYHDGKITQLGNPKLPTQIDILQYQHRFLGITESNRFYDKSSRASVLFQYLITSLGLLSDLCELRCGMQTSDTTVEAISKSFDTQLQQCNEAKDFQSWNEDLQNDLNEKPCDKDSKAAFAVQLLEWLVAYEKHYKTKEDKTCERRFKQFIEEYDRQLRACVNKEFNRRQEACQKSIDANPIKRLEAKIQAVKKSMRTKEEEIKLNKQAMDETLKEREAIKEQSEFADLICQSRLGAVQEKLEELDKQEGEIDILLAKHEKDAKQTSETINKLHAKQKDIKAQRAKLKQEKKQVEKERERVAKEHQKFTNDAIGEQVKIKDALEKRDTALEKQEGLDKKIQKLERMLKFIKAIQNAIKDNQTFFNKRKDLRDELKEFSDQANASNFQELYQFIIGTGKKQAGLTKQQCEDIELLEAAVKEEPKFYSDILNLLKQAIAEPQLNAYPSIFKLVIYGQNLSWKDCMQVLRGKIQKQLEVCGLGLKTERNIVTLHVTNKQLLGKGIASLPKALQPLLKQRIRTKYLCGKKQSGWPEEKLSGEKFETLINGLELGFSDVLSSYYKTIEVVTGRHLYIDENIHLRSVNLACFSKHDIHLEKGCKINTSGKDAPEYTHEKVRDGKSYRGSENKPKGHNGDDGGNGYAGQNAGHIFMKAKNKIENLDTLECKATGGKGADGQVGGDGDEGQEGLKTSAAQADTLGSLCEQSNLAIAHDSGIRYDKEGKKIIRKVERSEDGGHGGLTGLGGSGGHGGSITLEDKDHTIEYPEDKREVDVQSFSKFAKIKEHLKIGAGEPGEDVDKYGKGGEAGKAGLMGLDHSLVKTSWWRSPVPSQGQLSRVWIHKLSEVAAQNSGENDASIVIGSAVAAMGTVALLETGAIAASTLIAGVLSAGLLPVLFAAGAIFYGILNVFGCFDSKVTIETDSDHYQKQLKIVHGSWDPKKEFEKNAALERRSPHDESRGQKGSEGRHRDESTRNKTVTNANPAREDPDYRQKLQASADRIDQNYHQLLANIETRVQGKTQKLKQERAVLENTIQVHSAQVTASQQHLDVLNTAKDKTKSHLAEIESESIRITQQINELNKGQSEVVMQILAQLQEASQHQSTLSDTRNKLTNIEIDKKYNRDLQQRITQLHNNLQKILQLQQEVKSEALAQLQEKNRQLLAALESLKKELIEVSDTNKKAEQEKKTIEDQRVHIKQSVSSDNEVKQVKEEVQVEIGYEDKENKPRATLNSDQLTQS
jgi:chromosome segregation ATPase